jgi:prepilin-type N-terminal cleavage/methylation domain-containing protein
MKRGFILIEILVVVAIIGVLSTVVLAALKEARVKARDTERVAEIKQLTLALELYRGTNGFYPTTLDALAPSAIPVVPRDPKVGDNSACRAPDYCYAFYPETNPTSYHLGAKLEATGGMYLRDSQFDSVTYFRNSTTTGTTVPGGFQGTANYIYDIKF